MLPIFWVLAWWCWYIFSGAAIDKQKIKYFDAIKKGGDGVPDKGAYSLFLFLPRSKSILIGRLGKFQFPKGYYIYTGRASRGLFARLKRHLVKDKVLRWHIDYLTSDSSVTVQDILIYPGTAERECRINQSWQRRLERSPLIPGFGASDCKEKCGSHLVYSKLKPDFN